MSLLAPRMKGDQIRTAIFRHVTDRLIRGQNAFLKIKPNI